MLASRWRQCYINAIFWEMFSAMFQGRVWLQHRSDTSFHKVEFTEELCVHAELVSWCQILWFHIDLTFFLSFLTVLKFYRYTTLKEPEWLSVTMVQLKTVKTKKKKVRWCLKRKSYNLTGVSISGCPAETWWLRDMKIRSRQHLCTRSNQTTLLCVRVCMCVISMIII